MKKIVFFDVQEYEQNLLEDYKQANYDIQLLNYSINSITDKNIFDAEIISVFTNSLLTKEIIEQFSNLKFIATRSVGFSHIDVDYCKQNNIQIATARHYGDNTVAEFVFAMLLNVVRRLYPAMEDLKNSKINLNNYIGIELLDKTIGIIGVGAIGKEVARIAKGFGMKILGYDIEPDNDCTTTYGVKYTTLENLLKNSDFVSVNAPSTKENYHILNKNTLNLMKKSAVLINTARGELIDVEALYDILYQKRIRAAALDVLECESIMSENKDYVEKLDCLNLNCLKKTLINNKILSLDNVFVTPHIAYSTNEAIQRILKITKKNINDFISKEENL